LLVKKVKDESSELTLENFLELVKWLCTPFVTVIDDTVVTVSEDDCTIMMKNSVLEVI
jgi:hypothetical protein